MTNALHDEPVSAPVRELLGWVSTRTRTYSETIDAWRTSCPRLTVWEDALDAGLLRVVRDPGAGASIVAVTARGRAALSPR